MKLIITSLILSVGLYGQAISSLPELTVAPDTGDLFVVVDISAGVTKKVTLTNFLASLGNKVIDCTAPATLTISAGAITIPASGCYLVDTQGAASTDDLESTVCAVGVQFVLKAANDGRTVVIKDNVNILAQSDFSLDNSNDTFRGSCWTSNKINEEGRSNNGG